MTNVETAAIAPRQAATMAGVVDVATEIHAVGMETSHQMEHVGAKVEATVRVGAEVELQAIVEKSKRRDPHGNCCLASAVTLLNVVVIEEWLRLESP